MSQRLSVHRTQHHRQYLLQPRDRQPHSKVPLMSFLPLRMLTETMLPLRYRLFRWSQLRQKIITVQRLPTEE